MSSIQFFLLKDRGDDGCGCLPLYEKTYWLEHSPGIWNIKLTVSFLLKEKPTFYNSQESALTARLIRYSGYGHYPLLMKQYYPEENNLRFTG